MNQKQTGPAEIDMDAWLADPTSARAINAFSIEFVLAYMREVAALFGGDYEAALIFLAVLAHNGAVNIRQPWFSEHFADVRNALPAELARPVSRQAIAHTLGLKRETVRRKIARLIQGGLLEPVPGGVITPRGVIATPEFLDAQARVIGFLRRFRADLIAYAGAPDR
ncbi:MAG: helix-turn-helix domain-containing protein [Caulobacteraceae bacterium]